MDYEPDEQDLSCACESRLGQVHVQDPGTSFLLARGDAALVRFRLQLSASLQASSNPQRRLAHL
jgi:hypothetical protein